MFIQVGRVDLWIAQDTDGAGTLVIRKKQQDVGPSGISFAGMGDSSQ
jgi:hypothetical protein